MKDLLWWLFIGSKGGINRVKIIELLHNEPYNAYNISEILELNYKTVRHHLRLLEEHNVIVTPPGVRYGAIYFLSEDMKENYELFETIQKNIKQRRNKK
ncbi:MAG: winged helix-turn-helix transcriptional regulator [Clostridiaceae bacterium]|nr:winged helix-turn-helix transcriptional regulator [Clostridiaceae bacterium]